MGGVQCNAQHVMDESTCQMLPKVFSRGKRVAKHRKPSKECNPVHSMHYILGSSASVERIDLKPPSKSKLDNALQAIENALEYERARAANGFVSRALFEFGMSGPQQQPSSGSVGHEEAEIDLRQWRSLRCSGGYHGVNRVGRSFSAVMQQPSGRSEYLGRFPDAKEAALVYARRYLELYGCKPSDTAEVLEHRNSPSMAPESSRGIPNYESGDIHASIQGDSEKSSPDNVLDVIGIVSPEAAA